MPVQTWDVVVKGSSHHVVLDRSPDSGKHLLRVDGRVAARPFAETQCDVPLTINGKGFVLHVREGSYDLAVQKRPDPPGPPPEPAPAVPEPPPQPSPGLGGFTVCRGMEAILVIADDGLVRIAKLGEAAGPIGTIAAGGGLLGSVIAEAGVRMAQKLLNEFGPKPTLKVRLHSLGELGSEATGRFEQLPDDLLTLFSDEVDLSCPVLIIPRVAVRKVELGRASLEVLTHTVETPYKFDVHNIREAAEHLTAAGYPMSREAAPPHQPKGHRSEVGEETVPIGTQSRPMTREQPLPATPQQQQAGVPEVRLTAPLVTTIGRDADLLAEMEADAPRYSSLYARTAIRRPRTDDPLRNLGRERYDIFHLHGKLDERARLKETPIALSLKELIARLIANRVRMLWMATANDEAVARETLQWASAQRFFLVFTTVRAGDYSTVLEIALKRMVGGEPLSRVLPELEATTSSRFLIRGRGEMIFHP